MGPNTKLPYRAWDLDWRVFNRTYLVFYTDAQAATVRAIVGDQMDDSTMYTRASAVAQREIDLNQADPYAWFNLGSSLAGLGKFPEATSAFDRARMLKLPWRMLWYQFGPYEAYLGSGRYDEVIALANSTLAGFAGLEESLTYRGLAQLALGKKDAARASFELALKVDPHYTRAKQALDGMPH
jgi:tetratricopeptide (TPR) repeat protein